MALDFLNCPSCRKDYPIESGIFSCPGNRAGEEHTLRRMLPPGSQAAAGIRNSWAQGSRHSFDLFHPLLSGCNLLGYGRYGRILGGMTERLLRLEDRDFRVTPLTEAPALASALGRTGRLWVKNETGNVTGSHKGRHLMATLLYLEALTEAQRRRHQEGFGHLQLRQRCAGGLCGGPRRRLRTARLRPRRCRPDVAAMLTERGAIVERIPRSATGAGDPCYLAFRKAINEQGWVPFACAGNDNWSNIEGGATLGWEMVMQLRECSEKIDSVVIQVGGGALARSVAQAFEEALQLGFIRICRASTPASPRADFLSCGPICWRWPKSPAAAGRSFDLSYDHGADPVVQLQKTMAFARARTDQIQEAAANFVKRSFDSPAVQSVLNDMAGKPGHFMWPWDGADPPQPGPRDTGRRHLRLVLPAARRSALGGQGRNPR